MALLLYTTLLGSYGMLNPSIFYSSTSPLSTAYEISTSIQPAPTTGVALAPAVLEADFDAVADSGTTTIIWESTVVFSCITASTFRPLEPSAPTQSISPYIPSTLTSSHHNPATTSPYGPTTILPPITSASEPDAYTTIYTTIFLTICPTTKPYPHGTSEYTYTITEIYTRDQVDYTTPIIPPHFTTSAQVCDLCEHQPTLTVTRPIGSVAENRNHEWHTPGFGIYTGGQTGDGVLRPTGAYQQTSVAGYSNPTVTPNQKPAETQTTNSAGAHSGAVTKSANLEMSNAARVRVAELFMLVVIGTVIGGCFCVL